MTEAIISAQTTVDVTPAQARQWFLSLKEHPERYQFATHEGFEFVEGDFGEIGARFKTREKFYFLKLELLFELTEIRESAFRFRLIRPENLQIWGEFRIEESGEGKARLTLDIGSLTPLGQTALASYPVAAAVRGQIEGEVEHIKASMENVYQDRVQD